MKVKAVPRICSAVLQTRPATRTLHPAPSLPTQLSGVETKCQYAQVQGEQPRCPSLQVLQASIPVNF